MRALAAGLFAMIAIAATPMPAAAWCSHDRHCDCDDDADVVVVDPDVVVVEPDVVVVDHHHHEHFRAVDQAFQGTQPYWGQMRPYWGPNEPPGVIHRQLRTQGIHIRRAK